jgi:hypothetical protein
MRKWLSEKNVMRKLFKYKNIGNVKEEEYAYPTSMVAFQSIGLLSEAGKRRNIKTNSESRIYSER